VTIFSRGKTNAVVVVVVVLVEVVVVVAVVVEIVGIVDDDVEDVVVTVVDGNEPIRDQLSETVVTEVGVPAKFNPVQVYCNDPTTMLTYRHEGVNKHRFWQLHLKYDCDDVERDPAYWNKIALEFRTAPYCCPPELVDTYSRRTPEGVRQLGVVVDATVRVDVDVVDKVEVDVEVMVVVVNVDVVEVNVVDVDVVVNTTLGQVTNSPHVESPF
jgi:hypothetical protein